ncbi:helix-turn-helix domain-containing protein [Gordonia sp. ABSL11-1]|uniref:TetR/AcrR family transcriptional regulator n=1 Tax=Gordonia sp. ABSL11-1 TaxID=3053924 RepID=UPI0025731FDB|nr:TetR/AcrR family transcriptional regulator [Gordonia sp. ABSL11-1]MDL9944809.1 helix-turn-helix domain-containing protein [Gordonia sp. ABSL11-1]
MGRTQAYDTAEVVGAARNLFWKNGFDAVSVADVERATGLSRSSIYHAFGSMRGLFDVAVQDYLDVIVRPRLRPLLADEIDPDAVVDYLTGLATAMSSLGDAGEPTGCLLVGSAATSLGDDAAVREVIAAYHGELLSALASGVRARCPDRDDAEIAELAASIAGAVIAAMTLARVNRSEAVRLLGVTAAGIGGSGRAAPWPGGARGGAR